MITVKVALTDGDYFYTKMNATEQEARDYYPVGSWLNIGDGPRDLMKQVESVEIITPSGPERG